MVQLDVLPTLPELNEVTVMLYDLKKSKAVMFGRVTLTVLPSVVIVLAERPGKAIRYFVSTPTSDCGSL